MFTFPRGGRPSREDCSPYLCSPADLTASYTRCRLAGLPVEQCKPQVILPETHLASRLTANSFLFMVADQLINSTCYFRPGYIFILCDLELTALKLYAPRDVLKATEKMGVLPGTVLTEESCGTNALSLARENGKIVAIRAEQHYSTLFKNWWCVAGPVKDGEGKTIGYLDISMPASKELGFAADLLKSLLILMGKQIYILSLERIIAQVHPLSPLPPEVEKELTSREEEILKLLLRRLSSREIAAALHLSVNTVNTHRKNIYQKLGVEGLTGLLAKLASNLNHSHIKPKPV